MVYLIFFLNIACIHNYILFNLKYHAWLLILCDNNINILQNKYHFCEISAVPEYFVLGVT